ncbi:MAG TPA: IclR family transcriptional regulator [Mycobacteriales bacterium]|nr:IclR family transcriptional regulator [Mycobacteriales bacterium]
MGQSSGVGVLDKSVLVLEAAAHTPVALGDLVAVTGLPRATAHRLAVALEAHRLLVRDEAGRWAPGPRLTELAQSAPDPLLAGAGPVLAKLRDRTGESAQLYRRYGDERMCVAAAERTSGLRTAVPVGARLPMAAGSAAQVLAAWAPDDDQAGVLASARFGPRTLAEVRRRGWAYSVAQREAGVASVSAPIRDRSGAVVAAISVSGPIERLGRRPGPRFAAHVTAAAAALSTRL